MQLFDFGMSPEQEEKAIVLHREAVVIDMLTESDFTGSFFDDIAEGGLTCGSFTIGALGLQHTLDHTLPQHDDWWSREATIKDLGIWHGIFNERADQLVHVRSVADIRSAKDEGKNGILINTQNSICIGTDVDNLDFFYNLGLRVMQITYNNQNFMASGCLEDPKKNLSNFGKQAIERMNELGILVDTGHTGDGSLKHAIEVSSRPISCSHAGLASQSSDANPRVQSDSALKMLADNGGVFGLSAIPGMLTGNDRCTINDYLDHMEYAINLMGVDHVGLGTDFIDGPSYEQIATAPDWKGVQVPTNVEVWPVCSGHEGLENQSQFLNFTRGLVSRGYSDEDVLKLVGGNWLRLLEETIG